MYREHLTSSRCSLARQSEIWQFNLKKPRDLAESARKFDIRIFGKETIWSLFKAGLIRADLVISSTELDIKGFTFCGEEEGYYIYTDVRSVPYREEGYGGVFQQNFELPNSCNVYFHPFRVYILHWICEFFRSRTTPTQYLLDRDGVARLAHSHVEDLDRLTSSKKFSERIDRLNERAELSIVLEPAFYEEIFQQIVWRPPDNEKTIREKIKLHVRSTEAVLSCMSDDEIIETCGEIVKDAENIDKNKMIHVA